MATKPSASFIFRLPAALAVTAVAVLLLVPAALSDTTSVVWTPPTPSDQSRFNVKAGSQVAFTLTASTALPETVVHIAPVNGVLPVGASFSSSDGVVAKASFRFRPTQGGDFTLRFAASAGAGNAAPTLTYLVHVAAKPTTPTKPTKPTAVRYPVVTTLTDAKIAHWAVVNRRVVVRAQPKPASRAVTTLETMTGDDTQNLVLILNSVQVKGNVTWYRVRLPILPNNSTGYVRAAYLGTLYTVHTHLYVDRSKLTATLMRDGKPVFKTGVGVGRSYWPTPRGEFYVRSKLTGFGDPVYGPIAFGTSARSAVLTDWPGGGFVGIHGTNQPEILPGRVSHGCIRMQNAAILKLARLMPVGTPLTVL
jgi:hypothetical protein